MASTRGHWGEVRKRRSSRRAAARRLRVSGAARVARRRLVSASAQHASCDGARVNYVEMGEGSPVVFIHGLSGCWQNWLENIPFFARSHRVIAMDLPGFGSSDLPNEEISIPGYGRFVDAFLERDRRRARGARRQFHGRVHRRRDRDRAIRTASSAWCWCLPPAGCR